MKKLLSILLVFVMLLSLVPAALASEEVDEFSEITEETAVEETETEHAEEEPVEELLPAEEPAPAQAEAPAEETPAEPEAEPAMDGVESGSCGDGVYWRLENGVLTVSGNGPMKSYNNEGDLSPWYLNNDITSVVIKEGVTSIGSWAFYCLTGMEEISIADTVQRIERSAFHDCYSLRSIKLPDGIKVISWGTFEHCVRMKNITIPGSVQGIWAGAFRNCKSLTDVYYGGTQDQWSKIQVDQENNSSLMTAPNIHYASEPYKVTVTFDANGHGTSVEKAVAMFDTVSAPADLTASGYVLAGWYTDAECTAAYNFSRSVTENMTLYAKWTERITRVDFSSMTTTLESGDLEQPTAELASDSHCSIT